jgi:hypothetical protein
MKKKIIIASASVLFAVASVLNINMLQSGKPGDVSLENIAMMAQANGESGGGACCSNGYKTWFTTSNNPAQRKQSFYDCWCNGREGYDPVNCNC